jgi:hypothetical protein
LRELAENVPGGNIIRESVVRNVGLPQGARMAVTIQVALEAWQGTTVTGNTIGEPLGQKAVALGVPDWATVSAQEYGGRTGIWRILDTLGELDVPASVSTSTLVAERWPAVAKAVVDAGHEIVGHGYSQDASSDMDAEEDRRVVSGAVTTFEFRDADAPYVVAERRDRSLVAMPRTDEINDMFDSAENLTVPEALHAQTTSAVWLGYREGSLGSLSPGKYADSVILDCRDLYACDPADIAGLDVRATVVNGRAVHGAADLVLTGGRS